MSAPLVSIIIATYNRSNVLALALETVLQQTLTNWEAWVIGDACSDDTTEIMGRFCALDSRIHFVNLENNIGEQSGPNNAGFAHTCGRYIAYLNHDDLWLPDHLKTLVRALEEQEADMVFGLIDVVGSETANRLDCLYPVSQNNPPISVPASSWLFRRELVSEVGPWRSYRDCFHIPSQDWIFRVWKARKKICMVPRLTVVAIQSGLRPDSYAKRQSHENRLYFERIQTESDFRQRELAAMGYADELDALNHALQQRQCRSWRNLKPIRSWPRRAVRDLLWHLSIRIGLHPISTFICLRRLRRGTGIDRARQMRGLPPLIRPESNHKMLMKKHSRL